MTLTELRDSEIVEGTGDHRLEGHIHCHFSVLTPRATATLARRYAASGKHRVGDFMYM